MTSPSHDRHEESIRALLRESAEWRLLGRLFECPSEAWRADVQALAIELDDRTLREAADVACTEASEGLFHSVFGPGGPAPPREVSYHDSLELGTLMSALAVSYDAFEYRPVTVETPDHLSVEVGFVAYLRLKEAYARAIGEEEQAALTRRVADRFVADHLARMAEPLATLLAASGVEYLARASTLLVARVGPKPASPLLPMIHADPLRDDDEEGMSCPS
jgi:nitrate reductase assembly molybdenum cofactor insertion protein NarJ